MDVVNKVEYKIRDLSTRAIILFPDQAQVQRDIKDVPLKGGVNEITIMGLSPTVNQHSIKVEGSGSATIVGITTEEIANPERFADVYPDSDSDSSDEETDDADESDNGPMQPGLLEAKAQLVELDDDLQRAKEVISNADQRISILDNYCNSFNRKEAVDITSVLATYKQERERAEADRAAGRVRQRQVTQAKNKATKEHGRLLKLHNKLQEKAKKSQLKVKKRKDKKKEQRERLKEQKLKEKARVRWNRIQVWPKRVFTVTIQLEVNAAFTPASSRRGSVSSEVDFPLRSPTKTMDIDEPVACDLVLSYVTSFAYWTPSYDLQLSTPNNSGSLCFDACLNNTTSETWENCMITLSTSQTSFAGPNDVVPFLRPWKIKLGSKGSGSGPTGITESVTEITQRASIRDKKRDIAPTPRALMFGEPDRYPPIDIAGPPVPIQPSAMQPTQLMDYQMQLMLLEQQNKKRQMAARMEQGDMPPPQQMHTIHPQQMAQVQAQQQMQQQQIQQVQQQQQQQMQMQQQQMPQAQMPPQMPQQMPFPLPQVGPSLASATPNQPLDSMAGPSQMNTDPEFGTAWPDTQPALDFQESLVEETGLTTTYDLPGSKTLLPKFTVTKQRVARVNFTHVAFNHIVVAKYHVAAYLKATLKNNSKWALLRGPGSLTLDGSFMGNVTIPRCSAGDSFMLDLGIDPAIKVLYPKPQVKRSTTGMFSKEDSSVYTRYVKIHNTRASANKPIKVYMYDQIPVSEDERLRVDLVSPRGLTVEGPRVPSGVPGRDHPSHKDWGKGGVILRKDGQLSWDLSVNPGKMVKLDLEYTVSMPIGEAAEECTKAA